MVAMMTMEFTEPDLAYLVARAHSTTPAGPMEGGQAAQWGVAGATLGTATRWPATRSHQAAPDAAIACAACMIPEAQPLPSWAETLNAAVGAAGQVAWDWLDADLTCPPRPLDPHAPLPFEEVLLPFVYAARQALREQAAGCYPLLDPTSHRAMERRLLVRLSRLCRPALEVAYVIFRSQRKLALARLLAPVDNPESALYHPFVMDMLWGELLGFFTREPVLAQQAAVITEGWVSIVAALLETLPLHAQPGHRLSSALI
jgi:hypothetical protein